MSQVASGVAVDTPGGIGFEMADLRLPRVPLRKLVGYDERTEGRARRLEIGGPRAVIILQAGPRLRLGPGPGLEPAMAVEEVSTPSGFVVGPGARPTWTEHDGWQRGLQLELDAGQARTLLGCPLCDLCGQVLSLEEIVGRQGRSLVELIRRNGESWPAAQDAVESFALARLATARPADPRIVWATQVLEHSGGNVEIGELQRELGLSRTHLVRLFRDQTGLAPKRFAQHIRLGGLLSELRGGVDGLAELAARHGYADQSHMSRELRSLTGLTATQLRRM